MAPPGWQDGGPLIVIDALVDGTQGARLASGANFARLSS
jgi:hypothetical protein